MKKNILILTLILLYGIVNAQCDLQIDSTFTTYTQPPDIEYDYYNYGYTGVAGYYVRDITTTPDGRIFVLGYVSYAGASGQTTSYLNYDLTIYELNESGNLVRLRRFSQAPRSAGEIVESNGNLIYSASSKLFCFDPNNNTSCFPEIDLGSYILEVAIQPDGKILVGTFAGSLLRYMPDGTPDAAFNGNTNVSAVDKIIDIDVLETGQILVTGEVGIMRLNSDGTTDSTFGTNGLVTNTELGVNPNKSVELPTGDYAILNYDGSANYSLTYVSSGGVIISANQYVMPTENFWCYNSDMLVLPSGDILIGTDCEYGGGYLIAIHPDNTVTYSEEKAGAIAFQGDEIVVGGNIPTFGNFVDGNTAIVNRYTCDPTLLPVEMVNPLSVRLKDQTALLTWRTETETNNYGFEIQRSQDGINWNRIGWQAGQGTTNTSHSYTHVDTNPHTGISYYRLKQMNFDGQFTYSKVVSLRYTRPLINVFPNPVKDKLYINTDEHVIDNIIMFNAMGQQVNTQIIDNTIDVSLLSAGLYTIKVIIDGGDFYKKIVIE